MPYFCKTNWFLWGFFTNFADFCANFANRAKQKGDAISNFLSLQ